MSQRKKIHDLNIVKDRIRNSRTISETEKENMIEILQKNFDQKTIPDNLIYRLIVVLLGFAVLAVIAYSILVGLEGSELNIEILALGTTALAALVGMFAPQPR